MKKIILALFALILCTGCTTDTHQDKLSEEVVDVTDPFNGYKYTYVDGRKYLTYRFADKFGITNICDSTCCDHKELVNQIVDSMRAIIKEEVRVRLILSSGNHNDSVNVQ